MKKLVLLCFVAIVAFVLGAPPAAAAYNEASAGTSRTATKGSQKHHKHKLKHKRQHGKHNQKAAAS